MGANCGEKYAHHPHRNEISRVLTFAGFYAVGPRVIKVKIASIAAVIGPSTVVSATAAFAFSEGATLGAYGIDFGRGVRH